MQPSRHCRPHYAKLRKLQSAAGHGQLRDLRNGIDSSSRLADQAAEAVRDLRGAWSFDEDDLLRLGRLHEGGAGPRRARRSPGGRVRRTYSQLPGHRANLADRYNRADRQGSRASRATIDARQTPQSASVETAAVQGRGVPRIAAVRPTTWRSPARACAKAAP